MVFGECLFGRNVLQIARCEQPSAATHKDTEETQPGEKHEVKSLICDRVGYTARKEKRRLKQPAQIIFSV